ncbi:MAG: hypothetical protein GY757_14195 [bacterium]|nr:hypothetical protein [bacterium]
MTYRKPKRFFEDSGNVDPEESYYVPLDNVTNAKNQDIKSMVDSGRYFSIFSPRQSGKTTFLEEFCCLLNKDRTYIALPLSFQEYKNIEPAQFYKFLEMDLYSKLLDRLKILECEKLDEVNRFLESHHLTNHISVRLLFENLNRIIQFKKIIIFIDEFDGIPLAELENFLTTIRELYLKYKKIKQKALYSIGLVGIRNITKLVVGGVSPFNIADQVNLPPFSLENVRTLFAQYTEETNQPFTEDAIKKIHGVTSGQPWLVNRLGTILTINVKPQTTSPIEIQDVDKAINFLLTERNHHFDNLYEKAKLYKETFVEIVFDHVEYNQYDEEQSWLEQYGLIVNSGGHAVVTNNIYKTIHIKAFFKEATANENIFPQAYQLPGDRLDMKRVLLNFDRYISKIGVRAFYLEKKPYEKTGQFLLTAWLYQFVKGGEGDVRDEVLTGLGRMDIMLTYKGKKYIIETKVNRHDDVGEIIEDGILQLSSKYLAPEDVTEGYLVVFDTRTPVGAVCKPNTHRVGDKQVLSFTMAIGKP